MDKDTLLLSAHRSRTMLIIVFILIGLMAVGVMWSAYAGITHQSVIPGGISQMFGGSRPDKIAVIYVDGQMVADKSSDSTAGSAFSSEIVKCMRAATDDQSVKAIVLRVNSPGGTPVAAEEIISQMNKTRQVKPVVISMGDMATSAAYYISSQADRIFANPDTFTGSIGVIWTFKNKSKAYDDLGVSVYVAKSGNFKDMGSDWRGLTESEKNYVESVINESYDRFVQNVARGRDLPVADVYKIADGRVYTGTDAKKMGLVDDLGGLYDAIAAAKNMSNVKGKATIVYMNEPTVK